MSRTISQGIVEWLYTYGDIHIDEGINTDQLEADADAYGLYKTPQAQVAPYVNGTMDVTAYYRFLARQRAQTETERMRGQAWMESLETWVRRQNRARVLPELPEGVHCQSVGIANASGMEYEEDGEAVYQLAIQINYIDTRPAG